MSRSIRITGQPSPSILTRRIATACTAVALFIACALVPASSAHAARRFTSVSNTADGKGYAMVSSAGEVYAFGSVAYRGNPKSFSGEIMGISVTADGSGYAAISSTGQVYTYGSVAYRGNPTGFTGRIVGISVTADGKGYAAISSAGQVYAYGTVVYRANPKGFSGEIAGISVAADGKGYAAISSAGQVYAYGTVVYRANPKGFGGKIVGITVTGDGLGYAAISSAGQVYTYGTVVYRANPTGFTGSIASLAVTPDGKGYVALSSIGQAYAYGTQRFLGNGDPGPADPVATTQQNVMKWAQQVVNQRPIPSVRLSTGGTTYGWAGGIINYAVGWNPQPGPYNKAMDCGGFTRWVYALATGNDPLNANRLQGTGQQENALDFVPVSQTDAVPGDLVLFFKAGSPISHHVGIYIGDGLMIDTGSQNSRVDNSPRPLGHSSETIAFRHYTR